MLTVIIEGWAELEGITDTHEMFNGWHKASQNVSLKDLTSFFNNHHTRFKTLADIDQPNLRALFPRRLTFNRDINLLAPVVVAPMMFTRLSNCRRAWL
jgi:hypothetical protein